MTTADVQHLWGCLRFSSKGRSSKRNSAAQKKMSSLVVVVGLRLLGDIGWKGLDRCRESQGWTAARNSMPKRDGKDE